MLVRNTCKLYWRTAVVFAAVLSPLLSEAGDPTAADISRAMGPNTMPANGDLLQVTIAANETEVPLGGICTVRCEIHNISSRNVLVYMPGLTGSVRFDSSAELRGHMPTGFGGMALQDPKTNWVVLSPHSYYGFSYGWEAPAPGSVVFAAEYSNRNPGKDFGLPAWTGHIGPEVCRRVDIVGGLKSLNLLSCMLSDNDVHKRAKAARLLGYLEVPRARIIGLLAKALDDTGWDEDRTVGRRAIVSLEAAYSIQRLAKMDLGLPGDVLKFDPAKHLERIRKWARENQGK